MIKKVKADSQGTFTVNDTPWADLNDKTRQELREWFDEGNKAEPLYTVEEKRKNSRMTRLNRLMSKTTLAVMAIAVDQPELTDPEAIKAQKAIYDNFYAAALKGTFGTKKENEAVIAAHEAAENFVVQIAKLINAGKKVIIASIEAKADKADEILDYVESLDITKESVTSGKLAEVAKKLGL